jgi:hypothetical protein
MIMQWQTYTKQNQINIETKNHFSIFSLYSTNIFVHYPPFGIRNQLNYNALHQPFIFIKKQRDNCHNVQGEKNEAKMNPRV